MRLKVEEVFTTRNQKDIKHEILQKEGLWPKSSVANSGFEDLSIAMNLLSKQLSKSELGRDISKGIVILDQLAHSFILNALFVEMGWKPTLDSVVSVASLIKDFKLDRVHKSLIKTFLLRLEKDGILKSLPLTNGIPSTLQWLVVGAPPSMEKIRQQLKQFQTDMLAYPYCAAETKFLCHVANHIFPSMNGSVSGISILFPPADSKEFEFGATNFYENSMLMKHTKVAFMENAIIQIANGKQHGETLRILEIGAGTGGTTLPVLEKLINNTTMKISYTFTDISSFFVSKAKPKFEKKFPTIDFEFKLLDIEDVPLLQGDKAHGYDIIMVADVYHATQYLDDTVVHTRKLLKPNGILMLGEIFQSNQFLECTFGLTEGWWRFSDERKDCPLINTRSWATLLRKYGFIDTFAVTEGTYGVVFALADQNDCA